MFHFPRTHSRQDDTRTKGVHAWLVGADIGSLAAAVHLIQDAKVPGPQIHILKNSASQSHILEVLPANRAVESVLRHAAKEDISPRRILSRNYICTNDLLSRIPSQNDPTRTIQEELLEIENDKTSEDFQTIVIANRDHNMDVLDSRRLNLSLSDRVRIKKLMLAREGSGTSKRIMDIFDEDFFHGKFWSMWSSK